MVAVKYNVAVSIRVKSGPSGTGWSEELYELEIYKGPLHFTIPYTGSTQYQLWELKKQVSIKKKTIYRVNVGVTS